MTGRFRWGGARAAIKCSAGDIAAVGHGWFYKGGNGIKYVTGLEIFIIDSKFLTAEKLKQVQQCNYLSYLLKIEHVQPCNLAEK